MDDTNTIVVSIKDQHGRALYFRARTTTRAGKLFNLYCEQQKLSVSAVRFLFDGQRVTADTTLGDAGVGIGDTIDCVVQQLGG